MAASQDSDDEPQTLLVSITALRIQKLPIPGTTVWIYSDTSAERSSPYAPAPVLLEEYQSIHGLPPPGTKATVKLLTERFM
jgi:hypothetical protein